MAFSVGDFAKQASGGFAKTNLFEVSIYPAQTHAGGWITGDDSVGASDMLRTKIKAAQLPGFQIGTLENKRFGPVYRMANEVVYEPTTWTVLCSKDMRERGFFTGWMNWIHGTSESTKGNGAMNWRPRYYDEYVGTAIITTFTQDMDSNYEVALVECFPTSIGPIEEAWGDGQVAEFAVTMTFRYWIPLSSPIDKKEVLKPLDDKDYRKSLEAVTEERKAETTEPSKAWPMHLMPDGTSIPDDKWRAMRQAENSARDSSSWPMHLTSGGKAVPHKIYNRR